MKLPLGYCTERAFGLSFLAIIVFPLVTLSGAANASGVSAGTALRDITLPLVVDGKQVGATKLAAGSRVLIFEDDGSRLKVGRSEGVAGWVNREDVSVNVASGDRVAVDYPPPLPTPASNLAKSGSPTPPAILSVEVSEIADKEEKGGGCRRVGMAKLISVKTAGLDQSNAPEAILKTYAVLSTQGISKIQGRKPAPLEVREVSRSSGDSEATIFRHFQWENQCSCCKNMKNRHLAGYYCEIVSQEGDILASHMSDLTRDEESVVEQFLGRKLKDG